MGAVRAFNQHSDTACLSEGLHVGLPIHSACCSLRVKCGGTYPPLPTCFCWYASDGRQSRRLNPTGIPGRSGARKALSSKHFTLNPHFDRTFFRVYVNSYPHVVLHKLLYVMHVVPRLDISRKVNQDNRSIKLYWHSRRHYNYITLIIFLLIIIINFTHYFIRFQI